MTDSLNVYQKLQKVRVELQGMKLKKTGRNTFSNFTYYELGDFLPAINELCKKNGLVTSFSIKNQIDSAEHALLNIINSDDPSEIIKFICPTAEVNIGKSEAKGKKGAEPIQNLGGKVTYMRRYMLMTAFEMVESDIVDSVKEQVNNELKDNDIKQITTAKNFVELTKVCGKLKQTYKMDIITPFYNKRKKELENKPSKPKPGKGK